MCIYIYRAEKGDEEDDGDVEGCGPFDWSGVVKRRKRIEREDVCAEVEGERGREKERATRNEKGLLFGGREREREGDSSWLQISLAVTKGLQRSKAAEAFFDR